MGATTSRMMTVRTSDVLMMAKVMRLEERIGLSSDIRRMGERADGRDRTSRKAKLQISELFV